MAKRSHNFHVDCPRKWAYDGDVCIDYGGKFFCKEDLMELIEFGADGPQPGQSATVAVTGVERRGLSNQYTIRQSQVFISPSRWFTDQRLFAELGWKVDQLATMRRTSTGLLHLAMLQASLISSYYGVEDDHDTHLQLGKNYDEYASESDRIEEPDYILAPNARIENWLRRNVLY